MSISKVVAVIPARMGSVRLPGKNKKSFCGKPLIAWTVELALRMGLINKVIVSSDDSDILEGCLSFYGNYKRLEVLRRAKELAQDDTLIWEVIRHLFLNGDIEENDTIVILQPTSPLRNGDDIEKAIYMFLRSGEGVIPITKINKFYYKRCGTIFVDWLNCIINHEGVREGQFILIPKERAIDIDTLEDFKKAEKIMRERLES